MSPRYGEGHVFFTVFFLCRGNFVEKATAVKSGEMDLNVSCFLALKELARDGFYEHADIAHVDLPLSVFEQLIPMLTSAFPYEHFIDMKGQGAIGFFLQYEEALNFLRKLSPIHLEVFKPFANDLRQKRWGMLFMIPQRETVSRDDLKIQPAPMV